MPGISGIGATLGLLLSAPAAQAEENWTATPEGYANHLSTAEAWQFSAKKKGADGKPECIEAWTFAKDGTGSVVSGEQKLAIWWRYVKDEVLGMVLRITYKSSTTGKDCLGYEADPSRYPKDNGAGLTLLFSQGGQNALVCNAPQVVVDENGDVRTFPDGQVMTMQSLENCWGDLTPIAKG